MTPTLTFIQIPYPIGSMYGIFSYIYHKNQPNVGKYTIHGSYGYDFRVLLRDGKLLLIHTGWTVEESWKWLSCLIFRLRGFPPKTRQVDSVVKFTNDFQKLLEQHFTGLIAAGVNISRVSTRWWFQPIWKNISQIGSFPQVGVKIRTIWNHHPVNYLDVPGS